MPDSKSRRDTELAKYESMSTEELQALLREDASKPEGEETNMEVLFYVMEVLAKRRQARQEGKTPEEALESFVKNYMPEAEDASSSESGSTVRRHKPVVRRWMSGLIAAAATIALVFGMSLTANAFGFDIWEIIVQWTQETFHFSYATDSTDSREPHKEDPSIFEGLQMALDDYDISTKIVPTWIPEGYDEADVQIFDTPKQRQFVAMYQRGEDSIRIRIANFLDGDPEQIEQSESVIEVYSLNETTYYIFDNEGLLQAAWITDNFECYISGPLTLSEIKTMIDSIEKG